MPAAFGLGQAAPDAVRLTHAERELEAFVEHGTVEQMRFARRLARLALLASLRKRRWEEQP